MRNRLSVARIRALSKPGRYADGGTLYLMAAYAGVAFQIPLPPPEPHISMSGSISISIGPFARSFPATAAGDFDVGPGPALSGPGISDGGRRCLLHGLL